MWAAANNRLQQMSHRASAETSDRPGTEPVSCKRAGFVVPSANGRMRPLAAGAYRGVKLRIAAR
jgi:hypothetical protein